MSARLAALAAQYVGRRVRLRGGLTGTVTRVTATGLVVSIPHVKADDIEAWLPD